MGVFGVQMSRRWKVLVSIGRGNKRQWGFSVLLCSCLKSNGICYTERITTMGCLRIPHVVFAVIGPSRVFVNKYLFSSLLHLLRQDACVEDRCAPYGSAPCRGCKGVAQAQQRRRLRLRIEIASPIELPVLGSSVLRSVSAGPCWPLIAHARPTRSCL